jgi:hypothetical protein
LNIKPPKRPHSKPVAKAIVQQPENSPFRKSADSTIKLVSAVASRVVSRLLVGMLVLLALLVFVRILAGSVQPVAQVGDMLGFYHGGVSVTAPNTVVQARLIAGPWAAPDRACTLNVSAMTKPGGTMSVMAVRADGVMLSWAGGATAAGGADCKAAEQILVTDADYVRLQRALAPRPSRFPR